MIAKLYNLIAFTAVALIASTYTFTPTNALATGHQHLNRHVAHEQIAKRANTTKRGNNKRCKPRTSSAAAPSSSKAPQSTVSPSKADATPKNVASDPPKASSTPAAPAPPPTSNSGGGGKVGLAWPNGPDASLAHYATPAVSWIYSWSPYTPDPDHKYKSLQFMAQLWGPSQVDDFESVVKAGYANYILGFNEPNEPGQSNISPETGASLWKAHIEPKRALGYQTCSPATSSNPNGFTWVSNFVNACNGGCTFDYVCIHWYDVKAADFKTYAQKWHDAYGKDIFITEFAPQNFNGGAQPSASDVNDFYHEVMPWIMETSWIKGAFPFGFMHDMSNVIMADQLMASDGSPTALGSYIIGGNY